MVREQVIEIIAKAAGCKAEDITPDAELASLGLASLDTITLLFDMEETFDITIPNEVIAELVTVDDIVKRISQHREAA
ncbi:MAG: acyl carrier protein [Proteobacteria bacterium]|nr:acyl carrier protein [Pseudomonadota bacterium]